MKKINVGIIGAGTMGGVHARIADKIGRVEVASVFDVDRMRAEQLAGQYNSRAFTDLDEMLKSEIEMVFVCVPNRLHAQVSIRALEAGKHVFCEKPLAISVGEALQIRNSAEKLGRKVFVGLNRRFSPIYVQAKKAVSASGFKPAHINIIQNDGDMMGCVWSADLKNMGGFLFDTTVHFLDMAEYLLGEIQEVRALGMAACYELQDDFVIQLKFGNGMLGAITTCGHASWIFPFERVQVVGDHRSVITEELDVYRYSPGLNKTIEAFDYSKLPFDEKWGYQAMHYHMYDVLEKEIPLVNGIEQGIRSVALVEACYRSVDANGAVIDVKTLI
jgi:myo-inositol 2-dehydrogenase/D-chiro-inositol 1-dehydrogenase